MKKLFSALFLSITLFSCKKDDIVPYVMQPSHNVVVVASSNLNDGIIASLRHFVMLTDLDGIVLDFEEIANGTTTVLSTGDPTMQYFDIHIIAKIPSITPFTRIKSYHYSTGDTLYLGQEFVPNEVPYHSTLKVSGLTHYPREIVAQTSAGPLGLINFGSDPYEFKANSKSSNAISMYLTYGSHGDENYRLFWKNSVDKGSTIEVDESDLEIIPPLVKITFPQGVNFSKVYVTGKPIAGNARHLLAKLENHSGTNEVPIFIPNNFATDFSTEIFAYSGSDNFNSVINSDELPTAYQPPFVTYTIDLDPGKSVAFTGTGFDTYKCTLLPPDHKNSWYLTGTTATSKRFVFPKLSDSQKTLLDFDPALYVDTPINPSVTHYEPSAPVFLIMPEAKRTVDFVRRDIIDFY